LYDLYQIRYRPTRDWSGLATGMNFVSAGDELLGLDADSFAPARPVTAHPWWDVHDERLRRSMQEFYGKYIQTRDMAVALQSAMKHLRQQIPNPYFWARFVLVGKIAK